MELSARVGVPEAERAQAQRLVLSLTLWPQKNFSALEDDLARTIDYAALTSGVREFIAARRDRLIETLAEATAAHLLERYPLRAVRLELRKFVLPETAYVAVRLLRPLE